MISNLISAMCDFSDMTLQFLFGFVFLYLFFYELDSRLRKSGFSKFRQNNRFYKCLGNLILVVWGHRLSDLREPEGLTSNCLKNQHRGSM